MIILTIRTDKPEAEIGLYDGKKQLGYTKWEAHRQLSETIHIKIKELLDAHKKNWHDIEGVALFKGPGSFTGLRIGFSVGNAMAFGQNIPIVSESGDNWVQQAIEGLKKGENEQVAMPEYGAVANTTKPRK